MIFTIMANDLDLILAACTLFAIGLVAGYVVLPIYDRLK